MKKHQIIITSLGNALEWFDFGLFIFFAPIIGEKFFPTDNPKLATLAALSVFAAGFLCRPLGGILFGHAGDTQGRAKTLRYSVLMITISTLLIGLLPTNQSIGILSPLLFTILRLAQGISVGGEYSGVMIYLAETAPDKKRGFVTSFAAIGANIGFLSATLVLILLNSLFSKATIDEWAWRLPFILVGLPGFLILYYRFKLLETPAFSYLKTTHHIEKKPFLAALRYAPTNLLKIFGLTCMSSTLYYVFFGYMPTYLNRYLGIANHTALLFQSICLVMMLFLVPVAGLCGDFAGRKRVLMLTALGTVVLSIPCFYLLQNQSHLAVLFSLFIATLLSSSDQGNSLSAVVENCPANVRYSGIAFSYNLGMAIFGGTAPLIVAVLTQKVSILAPAFYLMLMAAITFLAASTLLKKANINDYIKEQV
jgi:MHS family proline/betaine transporter-like MFS transporter